MATTKSRGTKSAKSSKPKNQGLAARTGRTLRDRPYASAAIATGAVTAVAAAAAGAFFFSRRDKSFSETADELTSKAKEVLSGATEQVKKTSRRVTGNKNQSDIAEEALSLKEAGTTDNRPIDPTVENQLKAGAIAY